MAVCSDVKMNGVLEGTIRSKDHLPRISLSVEGEPQ